MSVFYVPDGLAGERLDAAAARITGYSRAKITDLIETGRVRLDSHTVTKPSHRLAGGELLDIEVEGIVTAVRVNPRLADGLRVVYEDRDIVVVDKPAGVAAHPSLGWDGPSVTEHLVAAGFRIATSGAPERQGVVQRLDVGTSGLMVLARSESAYSILKQAFRDRAVDKIYHALVQGHPDPFEGTIEAPIARHPGHEWKMAVVEGGRQAI
ncbi:MAG: RluA family pseudouridine synthase, partial [Propionibacteriaceae bacterium]|nr:RluA family pseudouridine synthase [Propionibacteriaceae bacterium]